MNKSALLFVCFFWCLSGRAQDNAILTYQVSTLPRFTAGDTVTFTLTVNLKPGWYIYAPTPVNKLQDMQVMNLKFTSMPKVMRVLESMKMPPVQLNKNHEVFLGNDNVFKQRFVINGGAAPGEYQLNAQLIYQACNQRICYPPVTEKINIPVHISAASLPAQEVIQHATARAKKENKKAFIIFHSSWCVWCRKMDTAMHHPRVRQFFEDNYVVDHLTVYESEKNKDLENPGAGELLKRYQPAGSGIPFWLIFDGEGKLVGDSQIRPEGALLQEPGENMGCPVAAGEVEQFIRILRQTSSMNEQQLAEVAEVFLQIK